VPRAEDGNDEHDGKKPLAPGTVGYLASVAGRSTAALTRGR